MKSKNSDRIARIREMEEIYNRVRKDIATLREYEESGLWLQDYEADERGEIPSDLRRGVLSQDGLDEVFEDARTLPPPSRKFDTCFFERYAQISLSTLLGREFDSLVNLDRPDLQTLDGVSIGIEVTRAMEESKSAEQALLQDLAGLTEEDMGADMDSILEYGYSFGLRPGKYIGARELPYWKMALPMRRILESKVSKVGSGFYGHFRKMGLFVFSKDNLGEADALKTMNYTLSLQKYLDNRYNRLYLADVNDLFVCNLDDGISAGSRMLRYRVTQEQRQAFYLEAVHRQGMAWCKAAH